LEELSSEEARAQFETNFFGVVRMVNAVLPRSMRQQRRGGSSMSARCPVLSPIPFLGILLPPASLPWKGTPKRYGNEVKPFNIDVSLTEAAFLRTPMMNNRKVGKRRMTE
jgi:hypothetical protein